MTATPDVRDSRRREPASGPQRPAPPSRPMSDNRPVEFWPTAAIRAALENDDLTVWQRIVAAIKRDPFGRTARQVGLGQQEFASRIGVPNNDFAAYLGGETSPSAALMVRMRKLADRFSKMRSTRRDAKE